MNVIQINCASFGSTGGIAKAIHNRLLKDGNKSCIFYGIGSSNDSLIQKLNFRLDAKVHGYMSGHFGLQGYFSQISTLRLIKKIKKIHPDIVHLHNLHGSYICLPILFSYLKKSKIQTIITLHDCWLFTGKCPHFTIIDCDKWKTECHHCPQLNEYPYSQTDNTKHCYKDKKKWLSGFENIQIITVSNWLKSVTEESFLSSYPIETIYNGIDDKVFHPIKSDTIKAKLNISEKFIILGVSMVWSKRKGLSDFIRLSEMLSEDEVIVLVGLNDEQIQNLPPNIIGIRRTESKEELAQIYSAADIFVNMSLEETFGLVTAEALACGTPVICYQSTACAEIIDSSCGYSVAPGDVQAIYKHITQEKQNGEKKEFRKIYSNDDMVEKYIQLYYSKISL